MKTLLAILWLASFSALAQKSQPSPAMVQGFVNEIEQQRNASHTRAAQLAGQLAEAQEQAKADKAEIERLKKLCGRPCEAVVEK